MRLSINLYPSLACNVKCNYCMVEEYKKDSRMTAELAESVIKRSNGFTDLQVTFVGGEPTYHGTDHIRELARAIRAKAADQFQNVTFAMITNGINLDNQFISDFIDDGGQLLISFDGHGKRHPKAKKNLEFANGYAKHANKLRPITMVTLSQNNTGTMRKLIGELYSIGSRHFVFNPNNKDDPKLYMADMLDIWELANVLTDTRMGTLEEAYRFAIESRYAGRVVREAQRDGGDGVSMLDEIHIHPDGSVYSAMPYTGEQGVPLKELTSLRAYFSTEQHLKAILASDTVMNSAELLSEEERRWIRYSMGGVFLFDKPPRGIPLYRHDHHYNRFMLELSKITFGTEIKNEHLLRYTKRRVKADSLCSYKI